MKEEENYLIFCWQASHAQGRREINVATFHIADIITRETFGDCRLTSVWLVKLWLVFRRLLNLFVMLVYDDAASDDNEAENDAYRHRDDEIKVISLVMLC